MIRLTSKKNAAWNRIQVVMPLNNIKVTPSGHIKDDNEMGENVERKIEDSILGKQLPETPGRCPSEASTLSTNQDICRICHCEGDSGDNTLIAPCYCSGSLRWVHQLCLQQWIKSSAIKCCELCKFQFIMQTKLKAFSEWESLQMTPLLKRRLVCNTIFNTVSVISFVWSLYILIDKTLEEVHRGAYQWPFWTKLIVIAFGISGTIAFVYVQSKVYVVHFRRWKAQNRVIFIQNAPEKQALPTDSPEMPQVITENPPQVFSSQKSNSSSLNTPPHSLLSTSEIKSREEPLVYHDMNYKALQQVLNAHYSVNLGCDKNEALKTEEKERVECSKKVDIDASSDEGETNGLLNI